MTERVSNTSVNSGNIIQDTSDLKTQDTGKPAIPNELIKAQDELSSPDNLEQIEAAAPKQSSTLSKVLGCILVGLGAVAAIAGSLLTAGLATGAAALIAGLSGSLLVGFDLSCLGLHILAKSDHLTPQHVDEMPEAMQQNEINDLVTEVVEYQNQPIEDLPQDFIDEGRKVIAEFNRSFGGQADYKLEDFNKKILSNNLRKEYLNNKQYGTDFTAAEFGEKLKTVLLNDAKRTLLEAKFNDEKYFLSNQTLNKLENDSPEIYAEYKNAADATQTEAVISKIAKLCDEQKQKFEIIQKSETELKDNLVKRFAQLFNLPEDEIKHTKYLNNKVNDKLSFMSDDVLSGKQKLAVNEVADFYKQAEEKFYRKLAEQYQVIEQTSLSAELKQTWQKELLKDASLLPVESNAIPNMVKAGQDTDVSALIKAIQSHQSAAEILKLGCELISNACKQSMTNIISTQQINLGNMGGDDFIQFLMNQAEVIFDKPELKNALKGQNELLTNLNQAMQHREQIIGNNNVSNLDIRSIDAQLTGNLHAILGNFMTLVTQAVQA